MAVQTTVTLALESKVPLTYQCEKCGESVHKTCIIRAKDSCAFTGGGQVDVDMQKLSDNAGKDLNKIAEDDDRLFNRDRQYDSFYFFFKNSANQGAGICPHCHSEQYWYTYATTLHGFMTAKKHKRLLEEWCNTVDPMCIPVLHFDDRSEPQLVKG